MKHEKQYMYDYDISNSIISNKSMKKKRMKKKPYARRDTIKC